MAGATDIKKAMKVLEVSTSDFKKSEVEALAKALAGIVVTEMTSDKDKESFLKVAVMVKDLKGRLKKATTALDEKHKPHIKEIEAELDKKKSAYKEAIEPFKLANRELDRIDEEAREAVTRYTTALVEAAQQCAAPAPGAKTPVFMPAAADVANQGISKGGHDLGYTTKKIVKVIDLNLVPENLCDWVGDDVAIDKILTDLGVKKAEIVVQSSGTVAIKIAPMDLPATMRKKNGVKERAIIELGGCPGAEVKEEYRPTVK